MGIFLKKSLLTLLLALIISVPVFTKFVPDSNAQWYNQTFDEWDELVNDPNTDDSELFGERYTLAQTRWVFYSLVTVIMDSMSSGLFDCFQFIQNPGLSDEGATCALTILDGFPIGDASTQGQNTVLATIGSQPISSLHYFRYVGSRLHIVPEVNAQGFGFSAGEMVLTLWIAARNVTYTLLIFVVVIMAFMIMFRYKISPQVVISVQSALPKLVTTLILITFSYAIAGFAIDLMYVIIGLMAAVLKASAGLTGNITWNGLFSQFTYGESVFTLMVKYNLLFAVALFWTLVSSVLGQILLFSSIGMIPIIISLIVFIVTAILLFKIAWMLIKNFLMIIIQIAIGPFMILMGAFGAGGFGNWIKTLFSYLLVYPVVGFLFFLSFTLLRTCLNGITSGMPGVIADAINAAMNNSFPFDATGFDPANSWRPPLTSSVRDQDFVWLLASLVVMTLIPKASDMVKSWFSGKPFGYGSAIGEGLAAGGLAGYIAGSAKGGVGGAISKSVGGYASLALGGLGLGNRETKGGGAIPTESLQTWVQRGGSKK